MRPGHPACLGLPHPLRFGGRVLDLASSQVAAVAAVAAGGVRLSPPRWSGRVRGRPPSSRATRTRSMTGMSCGASPHWPGVISRASGRRSPSPARWILQVRPPRERPSPSSGRCCWGAHLFPAALGGFLRAPAACWWARQEVESTLTIDQSMRPSASASTRTAAKSLSHVPSTDQHRCRSYTVFHLPKRAGRSRHGTPVRFEISPPHEHANEPRPRRSQGPPDRP